LPGMTKVGIRARSARPVEAITVFTFSPSLVKVA